MVGVPTESSIPFRLENVEDQSGKYLIFVVGANILLIFLLYFFLLAPSSQIAGPSRLKRIAEVVIPSSELAPAVTGNNFLL
jgi:hypothetical protein